ncbi:TPA: hypothetical protein N0F65_006818 [Lagenidium giganteum]|uniref:UBC core domain-containing protein n=1 Tax=Lagenidium giganteum TaxID=4803 RepID=A0AAV2ZCA0_9STRA|nr:TPA: hypothetical protein N0F65_006818 [Lagenidium giganteum]
MLRRLKNNDDGPGSSDGARPPTSTGSQTAGQTSNSLDQVSSLQRYRSQTMKDYGLMIEYKHLRQHVPAGIYVLPSFDESRVWYGVIFIHTGLYRNGIFKFTIFLPENYNGSGTYPRIVFNTKVFHPYVDQETRELDLKPKFPDWDPELHYMVAVLTYLKSIFYMKDFPQSVAAANQEALDMFRRDPEAYVSNVEAAVETALEHAYTQEVGSSIQFTKPTPAHENLRRELFAQLDSSEGSITRSSDADTSEGKSLTEPLEEQDMLEIDDDARQLEFESDEDQLMDKMILKHREALQKLMGRGNGAAPKSDDELLFADDLQNIPPAGLQDDEPHPSKIPVYDNLTGGFSTPQPRRSQAAERLLELSRSEQPIPRSERMHLGELSHVRNEHIGRAVIRKWNPDAQMVDGYHSDESPRARRRHTSPVRNHVKLLGEYSKDFVQQALDFNGHDVDDDDDDAADDEQVTHTPKPTRSRRQPSASPSAAPLSAPADLADGERSNGALRTYVKQMENTISQLVQQKEELLRNRAEFDKHASGIFPSLEHLNNQLSQIVHGKMLQSQVNVKEDMYDEFRALREQLSEVDSAMKRLKHDSDVLEQNRAIEVSQIKGQIISLVTSAKLSDEKAELLSDTVKKIQHELQAAVKGVMQRNQMIDERISLLQRVLEHEQSKRLSPALYYFIVCGVVIAVVAIGIEFSLSGSCGVFEHCGPFT